MAGRMTINKISNCSDLTIKMDNAKIIGDYSSLEINDISDSTRTNITMTNMEVMTHDEWERRNKDEESAGSSRPRGAVGGGVGGSLTVNKIVNSHGTKINQDKMKITGRFSEVTMNEVVRSTGTDISMKEIEVNAGGDSDSEDDSDDDNSDDGDLMHPVDDKAPAVDAMEGRNDSPPSEVDDDGLPLPSTYGYYIAEKFTFNIRLGGGSNVTCTFLQEDRVRTIKSFIVELQPNFKGKNFRLQVVNAGGDRPTYVDSNPEHTLKQAGFRDKIDLKTVIVTPEGDRA